MAKGKQPTIPERYEAKRLAHMEKEERNRKRIATYNKDLKAVAKRYRKKSDLIKLLKEQNHKCAICNDDLAEIGKNTHWDHCHKTGKLRSILCHNCNVGLGHFRDNTAFLEKAIYYIENWKDTHEMKSPYKYKIVNQKPIYNGRVSYLIRHEAKNGGEHEEWVGIVKLRRLIKQERIIDPPTEFKNYRDEYGNIVIPGETKWNLKDMNFIPEKAEPTPVKWNIPNELLYSDAGPINLATGNAYIIEENGRYKVVLPDGTLDDEWTNLMMAEIYRDSLNKEVDEL